MTNFTSDDLDDEALRDFYQSAKDCGRLSKHRMMSLSGTELTIRTFHLYRTLLPVQSL